MRLLVGSLLIAASTIPTIVHTSGTTFREIFDFSWQYALSPARAEKADRMAMADPTIDRERDAERERTREGIRKAVVTLRNLPLPDVIATLPTELTSPPELPVELVCDALARAAEETGLPPSFFARLIWQESKFKQRVVSHAGARGVAQFMPATAVQFGLHNPFDPIASVAASARFLRELFQQFGNIGLAAAAYNAGPRRIQDWLAQRGKMPDETRNYVKIITGQPIEKWTEKAEIDVAVASAGARAVRRRARPVPRRVRRPHPGPDDAGDRQDHRRGERACRQGEGRPAGEEGKGECRAPGQAQEGQRKTKTASKDQDRLPSKASLKFATAEKR